MVLRQREGLVACEMSIRRPLVSVWKAEHSTLRRCSFCLVRHFASTVCLGVVDGSLDQG